MSGEKSRRLAAWQLLGLGWYVALCVAAGAAGGIWLDGWLGLRPVFTLLGVLFGIFAAFYGLYKMVKPLLDTGAATRKSGSGGEKAPGQNTGGENTP